VKRLTTLWMHIYPTMRCNQKCDFCYVHRNMKSNMDMSQIVVNKLSTWIPDTFKKYDASQWNGLIFLGGEPLLVIDKVRTIIDEVQKQVSVVCTMFSNCDLIDKIDLEKLRDLVFLFHIRELPLEEIQRRADILKDSSVHNLTFSIVLTDNNLNRLEQLGRYAVENGIRIKTTPLDNRGLDKSYKVKVVEKIHKLLDIFEEHYIQGHRISMSMLFHHMMPSWKEQKSPYTCGYNNIIIDVDGSVRTCVRDWNTKIGTIWDIEEPVVRAANRWSRTNPNTDSECLTCKVGHVCQGGCHYDRLLAYGTYNAKSPFCDVYKELLPRMISLSDKTGGKTSIFHRIPSVEV